MWWVCTYVRNIDIKTYIYKKCDTDKLYYLYRIYNVLN